MSTLDILTLVILTQDVLTVVVSTLDILSFDILTLDVLLLDILSSYFDFRYFVHKNEDVVSRFWRCSTATYCVTAI